MPGIVVNTSVRTGPSTTNTAPTATWFCVGVTERGPAADPVLVTSIADYETVFGEYVSYGDVYQQVQTFFEEGGAQVYISRVVGASATSGTLALPNTTSGTALTLTAAGPGAWSSNLTATVTTLGTGKSLKMYLSGDLVYNTGECADVTALVSKINNSSTAGKYATATAGTGTIANTISAQALSAGDDDRSSIVDQDWLDALDAFDSDLGAGAVSMPGMVTSGNAETIHGDILDHCYVNHRIAILSTPSDYTATEAGNHAEALAAADHPEYGALYWPWVEMNLETGTALTISPEGFVAAKRSVAFNRGGAWAAYAGAVSESNFISGLASSVGKTVGDALDEQRCNALRIINGAVRVYGFRSLSGDEDNFRFLNAREMLNYVVVQAQAELEDLVFSPIDGRSALFTQVKGRLTSLLEPIRLAGGLYELFDATGKRIDYGYSVVVNDAINPLSQLAGGLVKAKVGIRVSAIGDQIQVDVTKSNLTASVV
jgi:hypothetical protein